MPKTKINDVDIYYESTGQGEPLVLVSGFGSDHLAWGGILNQLLERYRVITLDNRGAGQSAVPEGPYSIEQMADDVIVLCTALGIERAHFVGNSMGGHILQSLGYRHADRVKSLVISNSVMESDIKFRLFVEGQYELMQANAPRTALIKAVLGWVYSSQFLNRPGCVERLMNMMLNTPYPFTFEGYKNQSSALQVFNSKHWAQHIMPPTLVIGSDQDMIFDKHLVQALADQIPHAKYYEFKQVGHLPHVEQPTEFLRVVNQFITGHTHESNTI